ncbi:MAG: minor capsid protein [Romboutsia sp.]|nr:minor capsid protein [Romboutsia sp.]
MPKKNSLTSKEYWEKREAYKLKKGLKDLKKIEKELVDEYKKAMNEIGKEISNLFYKYANDNNLSYSDAKKYLNSGEFREFKRDLKSYMKLIEETGDEELLLELNALAMKSRISRLEEMFYQCSKYINEVYESTNKRLTVAYSSTIKDNYYQTIFDVHKSIGVGVAFSYIDNDTIKEILAFPWSGRHYSQNLWINRTKLKNAMVQELTQMIIQGKGVKETSKALSKKLDADYKNCLRLIHTEHSYFMSEATAKAYEELEVEMYQYSSALDKRTCESCGALDGEIFKLSERTVGVNSSPLHPLCRCTELPYIEDDISTRFARDEKGKGIEIPSSMDYDTWKKTFNIK